MTNNIYKQTKDPTVNVPAKWRLFNCINSLAMSLHLKNCCFVKQVSTKKLNEWERRDLMLMCDGENIGSKLCIWTFVLWISPSWNVYIAYILLYNTRYTPMTHRGNLTKLIHGNYSDELSSWVPRLYEFMQYQING